jgi:hypothetical protein
MLLMAFISSSNGGYPTTQPIAANDFCRINNI